jgi:hypothetical protein
MISQKFIGTVLEPLHPDAVSWLGIYSLGSLLLWLATGLELLPRALRNSITKN